MNYWSKQGYELHERPADQSAMAGRFVLALILVIVAMAATVQARSSAILPGAAAALRWGKFLSRYPLQSPCIFSLAPAFASPVATAWKSSHPRCHFDVVAPADPMDQLAGTKHRYVGLTFLRVWQGRAWQSRSHPEDLRKPQQTAEAKGGTYNSNNSNHSNFYKSFRRISLHSWTKFSLAIA
jgi:hypothetical protein